MSDMGSVSQHLVDNVTDTKFIKQVVALQELDTDLYMASESWRPALSRGAFGGQIVAQALMAASRTVPSGLLLHSMHSYFLRPGDTNYPIIYCVLRTRDGQSFSSRTVSATQKGKHVLTLQASFHNDESEPPSFLLLQPIMPVAKHHRNLPTLQECVKKVIARNDVPLKFKKRLKILDISEQPIEVKPVEPDVFVGLVPDNRNTLFAWVKVSGNLGNIYFLLRT